MTETESIAAAINLIDEKKVNLKKAFDHLQSHRPLLSPSFSFFSWSDIDSHFSSLKSSLSDRFLLLQQSQPPSSPSTVIVRPEMRAFCENMDGIGLTKFLIDHWDDNALPNLELSASIRFSPDPASMVVEAIEGTNHSPPPSSSKKSFDVRRVFVLLMESLIEINPNIKLITRDRAKNIAYHWKSKIDSKPFEALLFLHIVAAFGFGSEFSSDELSDYVYMIARYKQATWMCNKIGLGKEGLGNLIKKLLDSGKSILAVKFMYECGMTEGFEPVAILKGYIKESCESAHRICLEDNYSLKSQNEATDKEVSALKAAIRIIKDHKLESEFTEAKVEERVDELEKQKALRKRNAANPQQEPPQQTKGRKRPRDRSGTAPNQQPLSHLNPFGLVNPALAGLVLPYVNPLAFSGLYGSAAAAAPPQSVYHGQQQPGFVLPPRRNHHSAYRSQ